MEEVLDHIVLEAVVAHSGLSPVIDLLATSLTSQLPVFISPFLDPAAISINALSVPSVSFRMVYAFPCMALERDVLIAQVAKSVMVPGPSRAQYRPSCRATGEVESVDTAGEDLSSPPLPTSGAHPEGVVSVQRALSGKGFSAAAAQHISCLTQGSTSTVYSTYWKKWYFWCQGHEVDLSHPTVPSETDFFLFLWDGGLMAETIHQYNPGLASVFKFSGCSVFDCP